MHNIITRTWNGIVSGYVESDYVLTLKELTHKHSKISYIGIEEYGIAIA